MTIAMMGERLENQLLRLLRDTAVDEYERLRAQTEAVRFAQGEVLFEAGGPASCVYFQDDAITALVHVLADGRQVQVATAGAEGMVGFGAFLDFETAPLRCVVKVPGTGYRLGAAALRDAATSGSALHAILQRYTQYMFGQATRVAACASVHDVGARIATWLLMTHDRVDGDCIRVTHGFLASLLAVRRASVSETAEELRRTGAIDCARGRLTILDRPQLERAACECYDSERADYERLFRSGRATCGFPAAAAPGTIVNIVATGT